MEEGAFEPLLKSVWVLRQIVEWCVRLDGQFRAHRALCYFRPYLNLCQNDGCNHELYMMRPFIPKRNVTYTNIAVIVAGGGLIIEAENRPVETTVRCVPRYLTTRHPCLPGAIHDSRIKNREHLVVGDTQCCDYPNLILREDDNGFVDFAPTLHLYARALNDAFSFGDRRHIYNYMKTLQREWYCGGGYLSQFTEFYKQVADMWRNSIAVIKKVEHDEQKRRRELLTMGHARVLY